MKIILNNEEELYDNENNKNEKILDNEKEDTEELLKDIQRELRYISGQKSWSNMWLSIIAIILFVSLLLPKILLLLGINYVVDSINQIF